MSKHQIDLLTAAEQIAAMLTVRGVPVVVIGATALAAHRYVRFTKDIDLGVILPPQDMRKTMELLATEFPTVELHEADSSDPLGGVINVAGPFGLVQIVNFAERFPAAIRDALNAEDIRIRANSPLRIMPIPQLVALKLYAGGLKSLADIAELLRRNPEQDLNIIRETCEKYRLSGLDRILDEL